MRAVDARLVIFDQFTSLLATSPTGRSLPQASLNPLLQELHTLLFELNAAGLLLRNLPSPGVTLSALERSAHFIAIAASHLLLARDPLDPELLVLTHVSLKLSQPAPSLSFRLQSFTSTQLLPVRVTHLQLYPFLLLTMQILHHS